MQGALFNIIVGSHVWVEDPDIAWIDGQVKNVKGDEVEVQLSEEKTVKWLLQIRMSCFKYGNTEKLY